MGCDIKNQDSRSKHNKIIKESISKEFRGILPEKIEPECICNHVDSKKSSNLPIDDSIINSAGNLTVGMALVIYEATQQGVNDSPNTESPSSWSNFNIPLVGNGWKRFLG